MTAGGRERLYDCHIKKGNHEASHLSEVQRTSRGKAGPASSPQREETAL